MTHVMGELEGYQPCPTVQLRINELMASNVVFLEDPEELGEYPDCFEIYNPAAVSVDIGGVYVTDDPLVPTKYQIPTGVTIPGQGHLLFYADDDVEQGPTHTNFKLSGAGETLRIYDRDGVTLLDSVAFGPQSPDVAFARYPDGAGPWDFTPTPTPARLPSAWSSRPRTSRETCTSATCSSTRFTTSWPDGAACKGASFSGCRAPITRASRHRWS